MWEKRLRDFTGALWEKSFQQHLPRSGKLMLTSSDKQELEHPVETAEGLHWCILGEVGPVTFTKKWEAEDLVSRSGKPETLH